MANLALTGILEKMTGKDKDYRYMATSDLLNELNKEGFKLDADLEVKLSTIVIQQLDDAAGDVSGLAVKCLAPLVKKIRQQQVLEMTNKLCDKLLNGKEQNRDIASIALKTIVAEVPNAAVAQTVLVSISPKLIRGIVTQGRSTEIKCECLDILCDVLHKYGNVMASDHEVLLNALLPQLNTNQACVRKKAVSCIASLASSLSDDLLGKATVEIVRLLINQTTKSEITRTNIQMIGALRLKRNVAASASVSRSNAAHQAIESVATDTTQDSQTTLSQPSSYKLVLVVGGTGGVGQLVVASLLDRNTAFTLESGEKLQMRQGDTWNQRIWILQSLRCHTCYMLHWNGCISI